MTLAEALQLLAAFERHGVAYVLVGSMAMAAQGIIRAHGTSISSSIPARTTWRG